MGITNKLLNIALGGKSNFGKFISEWMTGKEGLTNEEYKRELANASSTFETLVKGQKSDAFNSMLRGPSSVGAGGFLSRTMAAQYHPDTALGQDYGTLETFKDGLGGVFKIVTGRIREGLGDIKELVTDEVVLYLQETNQLFQEINEKAMMTGEYADAFKDEIQMAAPAAIRLGIGFKEFASSVGNLVTNSGKFKLLSDETMKEMALASKFTKNMEEFVGMGRNFEMIGLGVKDMSTLIEKMAMKSLTLGLNGKTITSMVNENLKQINLYGFKNGVEGLSRMAQKSVEFRMNMSEVLKLAENVWEPDKALELVANLQVIGGAFGDLNDPIKLMYMATNNVEGLQDALIGAAESLVTYNDEQGRFEITGVNLRRAKEMAKELGVSLEELSNGGIAAAERTAAAFDLAGSSLNLDEKEIEFLTNLARMEGGKMVIDVPKPLREQLGLVGNQTQLALSDMTDYQKASILQQKQLFEELKPEDIPRRQVMALENIQRDASALRGYMRVVVGQNAASVIEDALGLNGELVSKLSGSLETLGETGIGKLDDTAKEAIKQIGDFKAIKNLGEGIIGKLDDLNEKLNESSDKKQNGEIKSEATKISDAELKKLLNTGSTTATAPASNPVYGKIDVSITPTQGTMDTLARELLKDPAAMQEWAHSFLNPNSN